LIYIQITRGESHMAVQAATSLIVLGEQHFDHGYLCGRAWYFNGDPPEKPVTWEDVVDFIKGNFLELDREGFLDEERLRDNAGFLVGWISGMFIPAGRSQS
jgi:hypothetical protein